MRSRALLFSLASVLAAAITRRAAAQPSADVRGFRASADPASGLYLEPASSPGTGEWSASAWLSYAYRPIVLRDPTTNEARFDVLRHQLSADLAAGVGVAHRLLLGADLPILLYEGGDAPTPASQRVLGDAAIPAQSLGDLGLTAKLTLVRPTGGDFGGFALALHERFTLPTGSEASYAGEGAVASETRLLAEYRLVAVGVHLAAGVKLRADEARVGCASIPIDPVRGDACPTRFGHEIPFGAGLSLKPQLFGIDAEGRSTLFLETHGYLPLSPITPFAHKDVAAAQLSLGARVALPRDVSLLAGVETALLRGVGNAPLRLILSVAWAPRSHDADGDGVPDDVDQCREIPEDRDGFEDGDGCPEADNDEDGVLDAEDRCPTQKEDEDGFQDEDGCPDPDNDNDKIPDIDDACPNQPGVPSPVREKNGCPPASP